MNKAFPQARVFQHIAACAITVVLASCVTIEQEEEVPSSSARDAGFAFQNENPHVLGTRCFNMAKYLVFENPMPQISDTLERNAGQPDFDFVRDMPTTWDETRFLMGDAGDYIVLARRSGDDWYLGGMTNATPRKLRIPLNFLGTKSYMLRLYLDGSMEVNDPNAIRVENTCVSAKDALPIQMAPTGGFTAVLKPVM